jgi:Lon protease-like protein
MSDATRELPLFPLNTVLFPCGPLPLRIFETRYLDMVRRCLREKTGFGVVLIARGREAEGSPKFVELGTEAGIVDFNRLEGGLLGITCQGRERFRVIESWRQPDGLNVGRVEDVAAEPAVPVPGEFEFLAETLRKILPELGEFYAGVTRNFGDAAWVGHRLAELLPLATPDKQALLEMQDPLQRLATLAPAVHKPET